MDLSQYKHGFSTNLKAGHITNADAALLTLHHLGGLASSGAIRKGLQQWRAGFHFRYLFNATTVNGYGFVGADVNSTHNRMWDHNTASRTGRKAYFNRRTYWYRKSHGTYALTIEGITRLKELSDQIA